MSYQEIATAIDSALHLQHPAVAIALVASIPTDIPGVTRRYPSGCSFWRLAEKEVFFASAADHLGCAVGAHVMGFPPESENARQLTAAVQMMDSVGYVPMSE